MDGEEEDEGFREPLVLSFDGVNAVDMDELEGLDEAGLREHFVGVAGRATSAQLIAFLTGTRVEDSGAVGDEDKARYVGAFVERRVETVLGLRRMRAEFRLPGEA